MNYIIEDSVMSSIADSLRAKLGTSEAFQVTDMASAIDSIPSGGGDEDWINYVEGNTTIVSGNASKIRDYAFNSTDITEANFPVCTSIRNSAFQNCIKLTTVSFPSCTSIGNSAFYNCTSLTTVSFPSCTSIGNSAFYYCTSLTTVSFPSCITIGNGIFQNCNKLTTVSFPSCTSIGANVFYNCQSLSALYLNSVSKVTTLNNANAFTNTPISNSTYLGYFGSIYVPLSLVDAFKSASNWVTYANRITAIPE